MYSLIAVMALCQSADDGKLASTRGEWVAALSLTGHEGRVNSAEFSPDSKRIITAGSDNTARIWDSANGKQLAVLDGHTGAVIAAHYSSDGSTIVTGSFDDTV